MCRTASLGAHGACMGQPGHFLQALVAHRCVSSGALRLTCERKQPAGMRLGAPYAMMRAQRAGQAVRQPRRLPKGHGHVTWLLIQDKKVSAQVHAQLRESK